MTSHARALFLCLKLANVTNQLTETGTELFNLENHKYIENLHETEIFHQGYGNLFHLLQTSNNEDILLLLF